MKMHGRNIVAIERMLDVPHGFCAVCGEMNLAHQPVELVDANDVDFQLHEECLLSWDYQESHLDPMRVEFAKQVYRRYLITGLGMALDVLDLAAKTLREQQGFVYATE